MFQNMNTVTQGGVALGAAIAYFTSCGYVVSLPLNDNQDYDLIIDDGFLKRVQVKSTRYKPKNNYIVALKAVRSNKTSNTIKKFDGTKSELVFILSEDGNKYLIPSIVLHNKTSIDLCMKYEQYKLGGYINGDERS